MHEFRRVTQYVDRLSKAVPFVSPEALQRQMGRLFELRLGANESVFGPSPKAFEAMTQSLSRVQLYSDPDSFELRTAIAVRLGVSTDEVVVGSGIDGLLRSISNAYCAPGDWAVTTLGSYQTFEYALRGVGGQIGATRYRDDAPDLERLSELSGELGAKLLYLANPDNPSGFWFEPSVIEAFVDSVPESAVVLLDEAYAEYAASATPIKALVRKGRVIVLRTFSKAYGMAGARIAYAVGDAKLIEPINRVRMHFEVSSISQAGALASLADDEHLGSVVEQTRVGIAEYEELARSLQLRPLPSSTNFLTIDAGSCERATELLLQLRERGVFIRKPAEPPLDRCFRVTVGLSGQRQRFSEILRDLLKQS